MKIISKNGKQFLRIAKSEWLKIGADFGVDDIFDMLEEPSEADKAKKQTVPPISGEYTTKNPLKSMPETPVDSSAIEPSVVKKQRAIQVDQGRAYEMVPKKDGTIVKRQINLLGVTSPEDLQRIKNAPKGFEESTRSEIIRDKIRSVVDAFKNKQFLFIGFWEKTKANTWRHMWGQIIDKVSDDPDPKKWRKLKILDRAINQVREVLVDNIDYIRGSGVSYVVDRIAANALVNEKHPEGKATFVGSALAAAKQALEQSKTVGGDKI